LFSRVLAENRWEMKLCFICCEYPPGPHGGIGSVTQVLARAFVRAGHQVRVAGVYPPSYPGPAYEEDQGVKVWRLRQPALPLGWIPAYYRLFRTAARWTRDRQVDLIEVPDWDGVAAGWPRLPVPVIARLNGSICYFATELSRSPKRAAFLFERASLRRADFWCSASRYTAERTQRLFSLPSGPHAILYNPVEIPSNSDEIARSKNRVLFSGTLTAKKGILSLIQAWPQVIENAEDAELHVYGKDDRTVGGQSMQSFLLASLEGRARETVRFHGHVSRDQLLEALRGARVAVFPSYAEAFAMAPLEAMSFSCPTISTERGSGPEMIRHGQDGLLVDPDQPADIAAKILRVLGDDSLAERLGTAGRERVEKHFSLGVQLPQNELFYKSCIRDFGSRLA